MIRFIKDKAPIIFLALFFLSISPFIYRFFQKPTDPYANNEDFSEHLIRLNSIDKMLDYADSLYMVRHPGRFDTAAYVSTLSSALKQRFHHGMLDYSFAENWIAWLGGKFVWSHLSSIVIPEDILKHPRGLCSQQTIVFMHLIRKKNIDVRSVGLGYKEGPGHFLCEVRYKGDWHLHDISLEPEWSKIVNDHLSLDYYLSKQDSLYMTYESKIPREVYNKLLERTSFGGVNEMPASNMALFHRVTFALTWLLPLAFLLLFYLTLPARQASSVIPEALATEESSEDVLADLSEKKA